MTLLWAFLIYWLVVFVGCYTVMEIGQDQLYDELTPHAGWKVMGGSLILAGMLTMFHRAGAATAFESMFTTNFMWTVLQAIVWFAVFTLIFQFHPWHALGLGIATMLLVSGLSTMAVQSMLSPTPATVSQPASAVNRPVRKSLSPPAPPPSAEEAEKAEQTKEQ
jgi:hypothetical protein